LRAIRRYGTWSPIRDSLPGSRCSWTRCSPGLQVFSITPSCDRYRIGYGVPGVWLLSLFPQAKVMVSTPTAGVLRLQPGLSGIEGLLPLEKRPTCLRLPGSRGYGVLLDMIHLISDDELRLMLRRLYDKIVPGGRLILRAPFLPGNPSPAAPDRRMADEDTASHPAFSIERRSDGSLSGAGFMVELKSQPR